MLTEIGGYFCKIAVAADADLTLARGRVDRPAARFNRRGQDALYLSPDEISARVAIGEYVRAGDPARLLLTFEVERCRLFDLRHPDAAAVYEDARQPWRSAMQRGEEPRSWLAADLVRRSGAVGLIDPSRRRPGLWHVTLFRWNDSDAPRVRIIGEPKPIELLLDQR